VEPHNKCINLMRPGAEIGWRGAAHRLCTERWADEGGGRAFGASGLFLSVGSSSPE
jgi:hypothetical protein